MPYFICQTRPFFVLIWISTTTMMWKRKFGNFTLNAAHWIIESTQYSDSHCFIRYTILFGVSQILRLARLFIIKSLNIYMDTFLLKIVCSFDSNSPFLSHTPRDFVSISFRNDIFLWICSVVWTKRKTRIIKSPKLYTVIYECSICTLYRWETRVMNTQYPQQSNTHTRNILL